MNREATGKFRKPDFSSTPGNPSGCFQNGNCHWEGNAGMPDRAQASAPLREGGAALRPGCPWKVFAGRMERAAGGVLRVAVGGGFRFAGSGTVCHLSPYGPSGGCHDGHPQYSPRRGPLRRACTFIAPAIHGRATPLSEGGRSCRHPLQAPKGVAKQVRATACKPASFPTIGNFFSNHWKNHVSFFQSLENRRKFFPIVGKTGGGADGMPEGEKRR